MEQLIELLRQIEELAGVGIEALAEATKGGGQGGEQGAPPQAPDAGGQTAPPGGEAPPPQA